MEIMSLIKCTQLTQISANQINIKIVSQLFYTTFIQFYILYVPLEFIEKRSVY